MAEPTPTADTGNVGSATSWGFSLPVAGVGTQKGKQEDPGWPPPTT